MVKKRYELVNEKDTLCVFSVRGWLKSKTLTLVGVADSGSESTSSPQRLAILSVVCERAECRSAMKTIWQIGSEGSFCVTDLS